MSRLILAALVMIGAAPAFADTAHATMGVGVVVLPMIRPRLSRRRRLCLRSGGH